MWDYRITQLYIIVCLQFEDNTNMAKITVRDTNVTVILLNENDYICLTDIARYKSDDSNAVIGN